MMATAQNEVFKAKLRALPNSPGVYLMKDRFGAVIYVGKAKNLKRRVASYFQPSRKHRIEQPKIVAMIDLVYDVDVVTLQSESEALLLEGRLIKQYRPRYNTDFVDDKQFLLVRVTLTETLPRFCLTRNRKEDGSRYFGPFARSGLLRKTLAEMRIRFGILLNDGHPKRLDDGRWMLYDDARAEIYQQPEPVSEADYQERITEACRFLEGKSRQWVQELKAEMQQAAERMDYEKAASLRDMVKAMEQTLLPGRRFSGRGDPVRFLDVKPGVFDTLRQMKADLGLPRTPRTMECFDISHISGTYVVASMVHFRDGRPDRSQYRLYRIRSFIGNDDFRAMHEVVGRRYKRLHAENKPMPDLVVIDGGLGQVNAAMQAFEDHGLTPPSLIGLAKREETVIFSDQRDPLQLPRHSESLRLLQRLRDEAHRFANTYSDDLRRQKIRESILLDMPGLGEQRRETLIRHFGSLAKLRSATPEQIVEVEGFGKVMAKRVYEFLQANRNLP